MRNITTILLLCLSFGLKAQTHYYVSATGSDANNGTSTATPWQTISKVNSTTLAAGDIVSFHGGDTFYGTITPNTSGTSGNPITYNSYGTGNAIITGFQDVTSWTSLGSNIWQSSSASIADFASQTRGVLLPRMTSNQRDSITSSIVTLSITNAGSGYTNGSYGSTLYTGGSGTGASGTVTVSGGIVTVASLQVSHGINYAVGDILSASIPGGSGFQATVTAVGLYTPARTTMVQDTSVNQLSVFNTSNSWTGKVFNSSASTLTLDYGDDYIFTGTTATYTLPAILTNTQGRQNGIKIKNRGSGTITLNAASGSTIYSTSAVSTITIAAGAACELMPDGTYFNVMYNQ